MLLEVTLRVDDEIFGKAGTRVMICIYYIVGVTPDKSGSVMFVNISDLKPFHPIYIVEKYEKWNIIRLNP